MQPNQYDGPSNQNGNWQPPAQQPSQAPYASAPPQPTESQAVRPVVSMQSDLSIDTNPVLAHQSVIEPVVDEAQLPESEVSTPVDEPVHWQAQEYIHHDKDVLWFILFGVVVVALMAAAVFLMGSWSFAILVPIMAAALLVYIRRPPRTLDYTLGRQGLHINDRLFAFNDFKGFGIIRDGGEYSVMLIPIERFRPGIVVYFPEESGEAIVDMLGARLPMLDLRLDVVDHLIRLLRI